MLAESLIHHNAQLRRRCIAHQMWNPIGTDRFDERLDLAVIVDGRIEWSSGPCRRVIGGWVHCQTHEFVPRMPTHWRLSEALAHLGSAAIPLDFDRNWAVPSIEP